jgi:hypothetical protein
VGSGAPGAVVGVASLEVSSGASGEVAGSAGGSGAGSTAARVPASLSTPAIRVGGVVLHDPAHAAVHVDDAGPLAVGVVEEDEPVLHEELEAPLRHRLVGDHHAVAVHVDHRHLAGREVGTKTRPPTSTGAPSSEPAPATVTATLAHPPVARSLTRSTPWSPDTA